MKKKFLKIATFFAMPVVAFLTLAIFLVSGISSGFVSALSGNGGGFFVRSNSKLIIDNETTISGNSATNGGGVYVEEGGMFTMNGLSIVRVDKNGNVDPDGDYVLFGSYPKTYQSDTSVITSTKDENGYYLGTDGNRYAKVSANPFYESYVFNDGTTIVSGTEYYFKVEPIKWRILKTENGKALLFCEDIIDAHKFYYTDSNRTINGSTIYANNYKYSDIRAWLNGYEQENGNTSGENWLGTGFLQIAFTTAEQNSILTTEVDNSASTTNNSSNSYACENTNDKIFLLSYQDMLYTGYGFNYLPIDSDSARRKQTTDYARANYAYYNTSSDYLYNGEYWLRSPSSSYSGSAFFVSHDGDTSTYTYVNSSDPGVVPALYISESVFQELSSSISGNTATSGNGNDIYNAGTFTMNGGSVGTSENEQTGYGIYNTGTMNLYGGTIYDSIYSSVSFNAKMNADIQGKITLSDSATINVLDYAGTTPTLDIEISDTRVAGTILLLKGSSTKPNLEKINISGFDDSRYEIVSSQDETTGFWIVVLKDIIIRYDKDGNEDPEGKYVFFGSYPKTIKASDVTVDETDVDTNGYFLGSDGERYAKVTNVSRPRNDFGVVFDDPDAHYVFSDGSAMTEGESYYFKVEPLKWKILSEEDGKLLIVCDEIVDAHCYYQSLSYRYFNECHTEPNSYYYSDIRSWLNGYAPIVPDKEDDELGEDWSSGGFLQSAFSDKEQSFIAVTEMILHGVTYAKASDKIFLLKYADLISSSYGYSSASTDDDERKMKTTDFSKANGVFFLNYGDGSGSYGCYWTGSPCREYDNYGNSSYAYGSHVVDFYGNLTKEYGGNYWYVSRTDIGVVPAMTINLNRKKLSCGHFLKSSTSEYVDVLDENGESIGHQLVTKKVCSECENIDIEYGEVESHYLTVVLKTHVSDNDDTCHQEGIKTCHTCGFSCDYIGESTAHNYETLSTTIVSDGSSKHHTETTKRCYACRHQTTVIGSSVSCSSWSTISSSIVEFDDEQHRTKTIKKCKDCGYQKTTYASYTDHTLSTSVKYVSDGSSGHHTVTTKKCSSCSYSTTVTGSTVSHSLSTSVKYVSDGSSGHHTETTKKCSSCSYSTTVTGSTESHSLSTTYSYIQIDETYHNRIATTKCSDCSYSTTSTKKMLHLLGADEICSCGYSPNVVFNSPNNSLEIVDEDEFYDDKKKKVGENLFFDDKKIKGNFIFQLPRIGT